MTEAILVKLIFSICTTSGSFYDKDKLNQCFEHYTNCAVQSNGVIMSRKDFQEKCLAKPFSLSK